MRPIMQWYNPIRRAEEEVPAPAGIILVYAGLVYGLASLDVRSTGHRDAQRASRFRLVHHSVSTDA